jgi:glycosyltransferase involved in cell wall biosynthesis
MRQKGFWTMLRLAGRDLWRDRTPNRLRRVGQACVLAREMPGNVRGLYAHFLHTPSSVARYAAVLTGRPWSFSAHAKDIWTTPDWEVREKLDARSHGAAFGVTCTAIGARHLRALADRPDRVDLVYHGLDLARFSAPAARAPRQRGAPLAMLSVGRLVEKKGFDRLIDALALLPPTLHWHWTHIGGGTLAHELAFRAEAKGVADRITWRGPADQTEVITAMRAADLFVLPSRIADDGDRDGLPNVLMEAASQKLPILSTPVSAIPEFIENGTHGVLSSDDPKALARAIEAIADDPEQALRMSEAAYARLTRSFQMAPGIGHLRMRLAHLLGETA